MLIVLTGRQRPTSAAKSAVAVASASKVTVKGRVCRSGRMRSKHLQPFWTLLKMVMSSHSSQSLPITVE